MRFIKGAWGNWFAWYPVTVGRRTVWLETIQRRRNLTYSPQDCYCGTPSDWEYKLGSKS